MYSKCPCLKCIRRHLQLHTFDVDLKRIYVDLLLRKNGAWTVSLPANSSVGSPNAQFFFSQTPLREVFQLDAICSLNMLNSIRKTNGKVQQNTFSYGSFSEVYHKTNEQEGFGTRYELSSIPGHAIRYKARQI